MRFADSTVRRVLSTFFLALCVSSSFLMDMPVTTSSSFGMEGFNAVGESTYERLAFCGTPMYNDPEYLRAIVAYERKTEHRFSGVGGSIGTAPSSKVSGIVFAEERRTLLSASLSPAAYYLHIMCKDVDADLYPVNPTTIFLPTDDRVVLLMTVTVDSEARSIWYYRNDALDNAWDYYGEIYQPLESGNWILSHYLPIWGNPDLPALPRGWRIEVYLDGAHSFNEYFEITDDGWQSVTSEGVDASTGDPVKIKDTFTIGVDPLVCYSLRLYDVAYYNEITDHSHDFKVIWYRPDNTVYSTWGPDGWSDYKDADPTYGAWGWVYIYGSMPLDSSTLTGQWRIETYIDTYYDRGEEWYLLTTTTFTLELGADVFYYYEYDQSTGNGAQRIVAANDYGQTSDGNYEIYYDKDDMHIDSTYLWYVTDAAINSWSELVPFLGLPYDQDRNGLIEVLIVDLNKYDETVYSGMLGYVQYNDANGLGMIYLDNDIDVWLGWNSLGQAFSHEFTHRIQFSYDPFEEFWIIEGMAQFGGDYAWPFCEYQDYVAAFQNNPDVQLTGDTFEAYYCADYVFFEYVAEEFGTSAVRSILESTNVTGLDGTTAVENALGIPFDTLFNGFAVRNYANDYSGTANTFEGIDISAVPIASHTVFPASGMDRISLWATDYVNFTTTERSLEISFSGDLGRAHNATVIKVTGDFTSYSVEDIPLTNNRGSITIFDANSYSQVVLMTTRHEDSYVDAGWSYGAEVFATTIDSPTLGQNVQVGDEIWVNGTGASPGALISVYWDIVVPENKLNENYARADGAFSCLVTIPEDVVGDHWVAVDSASVRIVLTPKIKLTPEAGVPDDTITVEGKGFAGEKGIVAVAIHNTTRSMNLTTTPSTVETDIYGSFICTFAVLGLDHGKYYVNATDADGNWAEADFTLLAPPISREDVVYMSSSWGPPPGWNPLLIDQAWMANIMYPALYLYTPYSDEWIPYAAESYQWIDEYRLEVKIRGEARWWDGRPVTAQDLKYTLELGKKYSVGWTGIWSCLEDVVVVDDKKAVFVTSEDKLNYFYFLESLHNVVIMPKHRWEILEADLGEKIATEFRDDDPDEIVGAGPYRLLNWTEEVCYYERVDDWWGNETFGLPTAEYIAHKDLKDNMAAALAFEAGEIDVMTHFIPEIWEMWEVKGLARRTYYAHPPYYVSGGITFVWINFASEPLDDPTLRRAIAHAIPFDDMISKAYYNYGTEAIAVPIIHTSPSAVLIDETLVEQYGWEYNIAEARQILDDAGIVDTDGDGIREMPDGTPLASFVIQVPYGWTDWMMMCDMIAVNLGEIGIECTTEFPDFSVWWQRLTEKNWDFVLGWADADPGYNHPWNAFRSTTDNRLSHPAGNWENYDNPDAVPLIDAIPKESDAEKLKDIYSQLQEMWLTDIPGVPVFYGAVWYEYSEEYWVGWPNEENGFWFANFYGDSWPENMPVLFSIAPKGETPSQPDWVTDTRFSTSKILEDLAAKTVSHELLVTLEAPDYWIPHLPSVLNATVHNYGSVDETDVAIQMMITDGLVGSTLVPRLQSGSSVTLTYTWTPTVEGTYNVTAYVPPVSGESNVTDNRMAEFVIVRYPVIQPVVGQWANYTITIYNLTGEALSTGEHNIAYERYVSPYLIRVEIWESLYGLYDTTSWRNVNTITRKTGVGEESWWCWIETNITVGSRVDILYNPAVVVGSSVLEVNGQLLDCWKLESTSRRLSTFTAYWYRYDYLSTFWYDKATGLLVRMKRCWIVSNGSVDNLCIDFTLAETNVPIGRGYEHEVGVSPLEPSHAYSSFFLRYCLVGGESAKVNTTIYNLGAHNETDVNVQFIVDDSVTGSIIIPSIANMSSVKLSFPWTAPSMPGLHNLTIHVLSIAGENSTYNNQVSEIVQVGPLIQPIPGQWANYTLIETDPYSETEKEIGFTYEDYVSPLLINVTRWRRHYDIQYSNETLSTKDRMTHKAGLGGQPWLFQIETDLHPGSRLFLSTPNATVLGSETIMINRQMVDCWVIHECAIDHRGYETVVSWWFDKASGLLMRNTCENPYSNSSVALSVTSVIYGNYPPTTPLILSPNGGEIWSGVQDIMWTLSTDPDEDPITYELEYSNDNGSTWYPIASGISGTRSEWNTTEHSDGANYLVRVRAFDGNLYSDWDASDDGFMINNAVPSVIDYGPTGTGVATTTTITVTFSESMNQTSAERAFSTSPILSGSFIWSGNAMRFIPDANLGYDTTYNVTVSTEAEDVAGENLQSPLEWQFTTTSRPPPPSPPPSRPPPPPPEVDVDLSSVSRNRCDVGSTQTICFRAVLDGENVVDGTLYINGTAYVTNSTGWVSFDYTSEIVSKRTWIVTGVNCSGVTAFEQTASNPSIVWDRIRVVEGGISNTLINITETGTVWYRAAYEYDGASFEGADGALYLNGSLMTWNQAEIQWEADYSFNTAGARTFRISGVSDGRYGLTVIDDVVGSLSITWIELETTIEGVIYKVAFTSDGATRSAPITTNSTISDFSIDPTAKQVNLTVSGPAGTTGTSNITIPKQLLRGYDLQVYIDGEAYPFTLTENETCCFVYVVYTHSEHNISVRFEDLTPPILSIVFPSAGANLNYSRLTVVWDGSDAASGIEHYEIKLDAEPWTDTGKNAFCAFHGLEEGFYTVYIKAFDKVGNAGAASASFTVDLTPPSISVTSPVRDAVKRSSSVSISWSGSDGISGIDHYEVKIDAGSWIRLGNETSYTFAEVDDGYHTVCVRAIDMVANSIEDEVGFAVNTSIIGEPGWTDDMLVFGAIVLIAIGFSGIVLGRTRREARA